MEPPVITDSKMKCEFFILEIILSNIHMISITGNIMQRLTFNLNFLFSEFAAHISGINQLFFDLSEIVLSLCDEKSVLYRFQIINILFGFLN